ncbi:autotransporter domain-containing protein [Cupriavidus sp. 2TAF22]|uniref:autotransporter outer membrane beta-barrel domain-containing protein n=1 Tax=unclassified Cupriavidus TaxID=2640874 RepID=UPI003F92A757
MKQHRSIRGQARPAIRSTSAASTLCAATPPSIPRSITSAALVALGAIASMPALAVPPACAPLGANTVAGSMAQTCVLGSAGSVNVTSPSGLISVAGAAGVSVTGPLLSRAINIENHGRIESIGTAGIPAMPTPMNNGGSATAITVVSNSATSDTLGGILNVAGGTIAASGGNGAMGMPGLDNGAGGAATGISIATAKVGNITNQGGIAATGGAAFISGGIPMPGTSPGAATGINLQSATVGALVNDGAASSITATGGNAIGAGIFGSAGGSATGINIGASTVASIRNDGTITATGGTGTVLAGLPGISLGGMAYGINVQNSTITGSINNNGTINATSPGGSGTGINVVNSTIDAINVAGTINAANAISIDTASTITHGVSLTGTLNGAVSLGNAMLNIDLNSAAVTGAVNGSANSVVNVNGTFTSGNTFNVGTFNIAENAVFNQRHTVSASAGVNNAGTLAVAAGTTATIAGNYTQAAGGVFQTGIGANGAYGKLAVTGTADISASNKIGVNVIGAPSLVAGTSVQPGVLTAGTLVAGPALTVTDNSALFDFIATRNGNAVDLCVARAGATSCSAAPVTPTSPTPPQEPTPTPAPVITVVSSVTGARNTPGLGAAQVLDALISQGSSAPAAMAPAITALGTLSTEQAVSDAVKQTLPLMTAGMTEVNSAAMHATNRVIQSRQEANRGLSSGDEFVSDRQLWFKPLGSWAKQSDRDGVAGYKANTYGMLLGADGVVSDKVRVGSAFSYMHSRIDGNSPVAAQSASVDGYRLIGYGSYSLDASTDISVQADVGTGHNEGQRNINFGGLNSRASSSYNSWNAHVGVGLGRMLNLAAKTTVTPSVRADYTFIQDAAYTENGADALSLAVGKNSTRELILSTEARLNQGITEHAMFTANLGFGYDAMAGQSAITASYVGGGAQFVTRGMSPARWLARGGLGFVVTNSKAMEVSVRYDAEVRDRFTNQTASVKLRLPF